MNSSEYFETTSELFISNTLPSFKVTSYRFSKSKMSLPGTFLKNFMLLTPPSIPF